MIPNVLGLRIGNIIYALKTIHERNANFTREADGGLSEIPKAYVPHNSIITFTHSFISDDSNGNTLL